MAQRIDEELDENEVMREVEATHAPDGISLAVNPLLRIIHNILQPSTPTTPGFGQVFIFLSIHWLLIISHLGCD